MSETALCRDELSRFCNGFGLDLGCGDDLIIPTAIGIDRKPDSKAIVIGDVSALGTWFQPTTFDFIFSSHCLEDFHDTEAIMKHWIWYLKPRGRLVLYLPDQARYIAHCEKHGTVPNQDHKNAAFSMDYVIHFLDVLDMTRLEHACDPIPHNSDSYSFAVVARKL